MEGPIGFDAVLEMTMVAERRMACAVAASAYEQRLTLVHSFLRSERETLRRHTEITSLNQSIDQSRTLFISQVGPLLKIEAHVKLNHYTCT